MILDIEKIIKGLKCCHQMVHDLGDSACGECPYKDVHTEEEIELGSIACIAALHDEISALLKEQEPIEPKSTPSSGWLETKALWFCGACGARISKRRTRFCQECGRAVKWNA